MTTTKIELEGVEYEVEFDIASYGSSACWTEPGDPAEIEITTVWRGDTVLRHDDPLVELIEAALYEQFDFDDAAADAADGEYEE